MLKILKIINKKFYLQNDQVHFILTPGDIRLRAFPAAGRLGPNTKKMRGRAGIEQLESYRGPLHQHVHVHYDVREQIRHEQENRTRPQSQLLVRSLSDKQRLLVQPMESRWTLQQEVH